jgi:hypothetical protein
MRRKRWSRQLGNYPGGGAKCFGSNDTGFVAAFDLSAFVAYRCRPALGWLASALERFLAFGLFAFDGHVSGLSMPSDLDRLP